MRRENLLIVLLLTACAPGVTGDRTPTPRPSDDDPPLAMDPPAVLHEDGFAACTNGADDDGDGVSDCGDYDCAVFCDPVDEPALDPPLAECTSLTVEAETTLRPADIVWVIDSSGSMRNEAERVQSHMNSFAREILEAGIDPRVVVITDHEYVTVPPPLGGDAEHYRFVDQHVGSNAPLERLISEYEQYEDFLRPEAVLHIVAVTDDESDISELEFDAGMRALLGGRDYVFHAIASESVGGRECDGAAEVGARYYRLADMKGGLKVSICTPDWTGVFDRLRMHITETVPLPCAFAVPDAPADMTLDYGRVNVQLTPGGGGEPGVIPQVDSAAACGGLGGWYYDDPEAPTEILLCETTCRFVAADAMARVDIALGCETVLM